MTPSHKNNSPQAVSYTHLNIHNEKFLRESKIVKQLKLRGSVGYTGNQNFSGYQAISTYKYYLDKSYQDFIGSYLLGLANDDLKWEQKLDYNVGLDALIQRLTLRFNYYVAYTDNLLTDISLPTLSLIHILGEKGEF